MKIKIDFTYEIITPESAEQGTPESSGWARYNGMNLEDWSDDYCEDCSIEVNSEKELKELLGNALGYYEGEITLEKGTSSSLYGCDPERDYYDGSETYFAAHIEVIE